MPHGHSAGRAGRNRLVAVFPVTLVVLTVEVVGGLASTPVNVCGFRLKAPNALPTRLTDAQ